MEYNNNNITEIFFKSMNFIFKGSMDVVSKLSVTISNNKTLFIKIIGGIIVVSFVGKIGKKCFFLYSENERLKKLEKKIGCPPAHWFHGNLKLILKDETFIETILKLGEEYDGIFLLKFGRLYHRVYITKVKYAKDLLSSAEPKEKFIYGLFEEWLGRGLLLNEGKSWFRSRKMLTPAFHFDILKPYAILFSECANTLVNKWKNENINGKTIDLTNYISQLTFDSLLKCIFGIESNVQFVKSHPYLVATKKIAFYLQYKTMSVVANMVPSLYMAYPQSWSYYFNLHQLHSFTSKVIKERKKILKENPDYTKNRKYLDFIDILISAKDEFGKELSLKELKAEVDTFMFAGHDTTSSAISFALYNLAKYPKFQEKCRTEALSVLKDSDIIQWNDISKLTYITQFLKESLRLYPAVPQIGRQLSQDRIINGIPFEKGTSIGVFIYGIHRDPDVWKNPEVFDPERFSKSENKDTMNSYAFAPFSAGPRNCIGQNFAMSEMKVILAIILKHFRLKKVKDHEALVYSAVTLISLNGLLVELEEL